MRNRRHLLLLAPAIALAAACASSETRSTDDPNLIGGTVARSSDYPSTLVIRDNCTAARVGPRHILTAGHCVVDAGARGALIGEFQPGARFLYTNAVSIASIAAPGAGDGGPASTAADAGATGQLSWFEAEVKATHVNPEYLGACATSYCLTIELEQTADFADVALIETVDELPSTIPIAAIDLDPVLPGDPVTVMGFGCEDSVAGAWTFDYSKQRLRFQATVALPAEALVHAGSQFAAGSVALDRAAASDVVTPGPARTPNAPGLCPGDSGGPVYRQGARPLVVGVNHSYTFRSPDYALPVTNLHTRLDDQARFHVGTWLAENGAAVDRSCSTSPGGCVARPFDPSPYMDPPTADAGPSSNDAGSLSFDAGSAHFDAGSFAVDAGSSLTDAAPVDASAD